MVEISVVIPVFNEEALVEELFNRIKKTMDKLSISYEVVIVDDGSNDGTWERIEKNICNVKEFKAIKLSKNFGHHEAITAGIFETVGSWIVVMDGDLQDRPETIINLYKKAIEGFDIVFVSRVNRTDKKNYLILQKIFYFLLNLVSGLNFDSTEANFSIISRKVAESYKALPEKTRFYVSSIKWLGFNRTQIRAEHGQRFAGKPAYNFRKRIQLAKNIIISYSDRPLTFAIFLGLFLSSLSICYTGYLLIKKIFWGFEVSGWASLMISIYFMFGFLFIIFGITGFYISKIFNEVKNRPTYIIDKKI